MGLRAPRCSVCGRDVRGLPDARKEGNEWYCSQGHFLESAAAARAKWKPRRKWRRRIAWTLGTVVVLFVGLVAVGAALGPTEEPQNGSSGDGRDDATPLGQSAAVGGGWRLRVLRVTPNANRLVVAAESKRMEGHSVGQAAPRLCDPDYPCSTPPPKGAQDFMVLVSLTYAGGGKDSVDAIVSNGIHVIGAHNVSYDVNSYSCGDVWPTPSLQYVDTIYSGRTVRGNICFQIAANDASSLKLYTGPPLDAPSGNYFIDLPEGMKERVWFALR